MPENPFEVTKAVDFTDAEIATTWVDLPGGGFYSLADPRSPMPTFLVGGKGGGRTHLLRYFSFALQRLRHSAALLEGISAEGYVGIYFRCGGLNSSRFSGKGQSDETWASIFAYYSELWLGRLVLDVVDEIDRCSPDAISSGELHGFASAVGVLFDIAVPGEGVEGSPLKPLIGAFEEIQRNLDVAINNVALSRTLDVTIGATPGKLVFGIPAAAAKNIAVLADVKFAYLLDEFENLSLEQQKYVNTLIREKQLPTTFLVGSRLFGLRTQVTLSAGEENRQGSEYDQVILEEAYRSQSHRYGQFCNEIVRRRLSTSDPEATRNARLDDFFVTAADQGVTLEERAQRFALDKFGPGSDSPWLLRFSRQLSDAGLDRRQVENICELLRVPTSALHEKFALFLLYRAWADRDDLESAAVRVNSVIKSMLSSPNAADEKVQTTYAHYRRDLYAQALAELRISQEYYGFGDFVRMSGYLPRNLLVVLKQVTRWSLFQGERPFAGERISLRAQREGVREASSWFLSDSKGLGRSGEETQIAVRQLASLFREMRFSDKPVEVGCAAFSTDRRGLTDAALANLDEAVSHSLILEVRTGRRDRNSHVLQHKYQLNPMLAPLFDLPTALRGTAKLAPSDLNAIFDPDHSESFDTVRRRLVGRMQAPFGVTWSQAALDLG